VIVYLILNQRSIIAQLIASKPIQVKSARMGVVSKPVTRPMVAKASRGSKLFFGVLATFISLRLDTPANEIGIANNCAIRGIVIKVRPITPPSNDVVKGWVASSPPISSNSKYPLRLMRLPSLINTCHRCK